MQRGELFAEQGGVAEIAQLQIFQHEKAVSICGAVCDRPWHAEGIRRGDRIEPCGLYDKHWHMLGIVELEEIVRTVRSLQR